MKRSLKNPALKNSDRQKFVANSAGAERVRIKFQEGLARHQQGQLTQALALYRQVLKLQPRHHDALHLSGLIAAQSGKYPYALDLFDQAIALFAHNAVFHSNRGLALQELHRQDEALDSFNLAIDLEPGLADAHYNRGITLQALHRWDEALASYDQTVILQPDFASAYNNRGQVLHHLKRFDEALLSYEQAARYWPDSAIVPINRGLTLKQLNRQDEALTSFDHAMQLDPKLADGHLKRGDLLREVNRQDEALLSYDQAIRLKPDFADAYLNRGNTLLDLRRLDDAFFSFDRALAIDADYAEAHNSRGMALVAMNRVEEALASYQHAIEVKPTYEDVYNNRGLALHTLHRLDEALRSFDEAIEIKADFAVAYSNRLFTMQFGRLRSPADLRAEHDRFAARFEAPLRPDWRRHANSREAERRLKVAYVSPDFRNHAVAHFIEPVLAKHDKARFEVSCYYSNPQHDAITERLAGYADRWLDCKSLTDAQLAERIRADEIDILVDLAGHTGNNRLLTFARKPAPIQVTYLGYPGSSGLSAMDYRLTDGCADPQGSEANYSEELLRLPHSLWCYRPRQDMPEMTPLPALQNGYLTFGSFNNFNKIDVHCLDLWSQLLKSVPDSRLLMVTVPEGEPRQRLLDQFVARGVAADRLAFQGQLSGAEFQRMIQSVDLTLDPVSVNGATTTCESLWVGVPVLTLAGDRFLERAGLSILSAAGLSEFVAATPQQFIDISIRFANEIERLAQIRMSLRAKVAASPLADEAKFTRSLETLYREVWAKWCKQAV